MSGDFDVTDRLLVALTLLVLAGVLAALAWAAWTNRSSACQRPGCGHPAFWVVTARPTAPWSPGGARLTPLDGEGPQVFLGPPARWTGPPRRLCHGCVSTSKDLWPVGAEPWKGVDW